MERTLHLGDCTLRVLGTIPGFVPDGRRVQEALLEGAVSVVALGVPPEDLPALAALAAGATIPEPGPVLEGAAAPAAGAPGTEGMFGHARTEPLPGSQDGDGFAALDETQRRFLELLGRFGPTRLPSPDLEAAFRWAQENDRPLEALDLDDEGHAEVYIRTNKFRHVLRSGRILRRLVKQEFPEATDAHELAVAWDRYQNDMPSLQAVEAAREAHMAERLRALAKAYPSVLAVVPAGRFEGVLARLAETA